MKLRGNSRSVRSQRAAKCAASVARVLATSLLLVLVVPRPAAAQTVVLDGMPTYYWWGGCSPTSAGMIIGYWNDPDLYPFYDGDATVWSGDSYNSNGSAPTDTAAMVASWEHVHEGEGLGYNTSIGCGHYTSSERDADCIADFMGTNNGGTGLGGMLNGLENFAAWDNPATPDFNESVEATTDRYLYKVLFGDPDDVWGEFTSEIAGGRPMLMNLSTASSGHSVAAYGYIDNTGTTDDWFAVMDTWSSSGQNPPGSYTEGGVEWWPWRPYDSSYDSTWDWHVDSGVTFYAEAVPEPTTTALLVIGVGAITLRLRRSNRKQ